MSTVKVSASLFCAVLLFALAVAPASAMPVNDSPRSARLERVERTAPPAVDAAKIAFVQSLAQGHVTKPGKSPRQALKALPVSCEESWFFNWTKCCSEYGCCSWYGDGQGPVCINW